MVPGFAPDSGLGAERDEGAGLCQRQAAEPLFPRRSGFTNTGGQTAPRPLWLLGAGGEGASDGLPAPAGGAGAAVGQEGPGAEGSSCRSAVGAPLSGPGAQLQWTTAQHHSDATALAQPAGSYYFSTSFFHLKMSMDENRCFLCSLSVGPHHLSLVFIPFPVFSSHKISNIEKTIVYLWRCLLLLLELWEVAEGFGGQSSRSPPGSEVNPFHQSAAGRNNQCGWILMPTTGQVTRFTTADVYSLL